jgi:hypothetical protein
MPAPWQLGRNGYRLLHHDLVGVLRLSGSAPGLRNIRVAAGRTTTHWPGPILAVRLVQAVGTTPAEVSFPASRIEHRLRSGLVDIQLNESNRCPVRLQCYWSATRPRQIDMEILVTSIHSFERLEVLTASVASVPESGRSECLVKSNRWLDVPDAGTASWVVVPRDAAASAASFDGRQPSINDMMLVPPSPTPLVCYRPAGQRWSYVEMSHPDDCARVLARRAGRRIEWGFGLFGLDIEKGVILRGRVRGVIVPRREDLRRAARLLRRFITEPPHLSV